MVAINGNVVEFRFFRPEARSVKVAGDFNGWRLDELPMTRSPDGYWRASKRLPPGVFRFRYCADGQWFPDYAAFGLEEGPYGFDSVLVVGPPAPSTVD